MNSDVLYFCMTVNCNSPITFTLIFFFFFFFLGGGGDLAALNVKM